MHAHRDASATSAAPLVAPEPAFFFSDAHLGAAKPGEERLKLERLLRFFELVRPSRGSLFCLGDLFDFWFEYETAIPSRYFAVLRRLQELREGGVRLFFLGGNHDFWVRRGGSGFLEREIGFVVVEDGSLVETAGLRLLLFHGDGLGRSDLGYRALKVVLRNRLAIEAFRWVHPDLARRLGSLTSRLSRLKDGGVARDEACARIRDHAKRVLGAHPDVDAIIAGHAHRPEETAVGHSRYVNLGDWITHATYAVAEKGTLTLCRFGKEEDPAAPPILLASAHAEPPKGRALNRDRG